MAELKTHFVSGIRYRSQVARDYADKIKNLDEQSRRPALFAQNCKRLAHFLRACGPGQQDSPSFAQFYALDGSSPLLAEPFSLQNPGLADQHQNKLLFLSGYPSLQALLEIGGRLGVNPDYFDTHLTFIRGPGDVQSSYTHPSYYSLPSSQTVVFQASIPAVGSVPEGEDDGVLEKRRESTAAKMSLYLNSLERGENWQPSQSVVRAIEVHDKRRFSLEQFATIIIQRQRDDPSKWIVVIWSDMGRPLAESPKGPWYHPVLDRSLTHFRPVVLGVHGEYSHSWRRQPAGQHGNGPQHLDSVQSATLLPQTYGHSLDPGLAAVNPLYLLAELFHFISASEVQYLDVIRSVLDDHVEARRAGDQTVHEDDVRASLDFHYKGLETRRDRIGAVVNFLETQLELHPADGAARVALVMRDFRYLIDQANRLMTRCDHEWNVIMSEAAVADAQWGRTQSRAQQRFALLASVYLPFTFSCAVFGMTFFELDSIAQGFKLWASVTVPVFAISTAALYWDSIPRVWRGMRDRMRRFVHESREPSSLGRG